MNTPIVGDTRKSYCDTCDETTDQYFYHSADWICEVCGEKVIR